MQWLWPGVLVGSLPPRLARNGSNDPPPRGWRQKRDESSIPPFDDLIGEDETAFPWKLILIATARKTMRKPGRRFARKLATSTSTKKRSNRLEYERDPFLTRNSDDLDIVPLPCYPEQSPQDLPMLCCLFQHDVQFLGSISVNKSQILCNLGANLEMTVVGYALRSRVGFQTRLKPTLWNQHVIFVCASDLLPVYGTVHRVVLPTPFFPAENGSGTILGLLTNTAIPYLERRMCICLVLLCRPKILCQKLLRCPKNLCKYVLRAQFFRSC